MKPTIFLDMDGVLADFDRRASMLLDYNMSNYEYEYRHGTPAFWSKINSDPEFFLNLYPMPDASNLVEGVLATGCETKVLTALPKKDAENVANQKRAWLYNHHITRHLPAITCQRHEKANYCKLFDVLIDDKAETGEEWTKAGGKFIHHRSARLSLEELQDYLKNLNMTD